MIALYIIIGLLVFVSLILFLPITVKITFKENFIIKVMFSGIKIYELDTSKPKPESKDIKHTETVGETKENKKPNIFEKLKEKYGFTNTIKILFSFANDLLTHIKKLLRHIKINKVILNLSVTGDDAAATAIEYGAVCSAVYPVLGLLSSVAQIKYKSINVSADFNSNKPQLDFKLNVSSRVFYLLIAAFKAFKEYKNFTEEYIDERK